MCNTRRPDPGSATRTSCAPDATLSATTAGEKSVLIYEVEKKIEEHYQRVVLDTPSSEDGRDDAPRGTEGRTRRR